MHTKTGAEIWHYIQQVRHHWVGLVAGAIVAVLGFVANGAGLTIPAWAFWALALIFLAVAQFRAFRDVRRELDVIQVRLRAEDERRKRLREAHELTGEEFYLWELLAPNGRPLVENRQFTDCRIKGPGIVTFVSSVELVNNDLGEGAFESVLYLGVPNAPRQGLVGFVNCKFERCRFRQVGYYGDKAMLAKLRGGTVTV